MTRITGVDVGGTFTDLACFDTATGEFSVAKVPSNRGDEAIGFLEGLSKFGAISGLTAIVHAPRSAPMPCWNARVPVSASSPPRVSAMCWKCAAATAARHGACG